MTCPNINEPRGCWNVRCQLGKECIDPKRNDADQEQAAPPPRPALSCKHSNRSDCGLFGMEEAAPVKFQRPSREWYASKIAETLDDDFVIGTEPLAAPGAAIAAREQEAKVPKAGSFLMQRIDAAADALSEVLAFQRLNDDRKTRVARALSGLRGLQSIATPSAASREEAPATPQAGDDFSGCKPPMRHIPGVNVELLRRAALTQPTTVQQAEPTDVQMEQIADAIWGAQKKRLPMSAAIEFARAVLALKTAQTTALPGGNGEGE